MISSLLNTLQMLWQFSQIEHDCSELKKRITSLLERQWAVKITFKRSITLDMSCTISCLVWRCCSEISLPDLIVILWETWAGTHTLSKEVVVVEKQMILVYNLETAEEEEDLSSLIIWLKLTYTTYLIWSRVSTATVKRVLVKNKAVISAQRD